MFIMENENDQNMEEIIDSSLVPCTNDRKEMHRPQRQIRKPVWLNDMELY